MNLDTEEVKLGKEYIILFCEYKYQYYIENNHKYKIIIKKKNLEFVGEIHLENKSYYIAEIQEEETNIIICKDNKLYKFDIYSKKLIFLYEMEIKLILQINNNEYIISNNNGTFKYKGSILNITRESLEIETKKISEKTYNLGVLINKEIIVLSNKEKNKLLTYNINRMEKIYEQQRSFSENCYALLSDKNSPNNNILLYDFKDGKQYKFCIVDGNGDKKPIERDDFNFEINSIISIKNNIEEIIESFSEKYNKNYYYLLAGGYDHKSEENKIKLYIISDCYNCVIKIKEIKIEINNILNKLPSIKNIIQIDYKHLLFNFNGYTILFVIKNLEIREHQIIENNILQENLNRISRQNSFRLNVIDNLPFARIPIKYVYPLENNYFIIVQESRFSVVYAKDFSRCYNFDIKGSINCICPIKEDQVFICQSNGLYKLLFLDYNFNNDEVIKVKINDEKYKCILKIPNRDNEYIVSHFEKEGAYKVDRDLSSIGKQDLNEKISETSFNKGKIIEINNNQIAILINNKENKEFININNKENKYIPNKSNYFDILSDNCIASFKPKRDLNNHIFVCASKRENEYRIYAYNIKSPIDQTFQIFKDIYNLEITCISIYKNEKVESEKSFFYLFIGGTNINNNDEIRLYKIIFFDQNKDCLCIRFLAKFAYSNERIDGINFIIQFYEYIIIAFNNNLCKMDISIGDEEDSQ